MDDWRDLEEPWQRLRWARIHRGGHEKATDAARAVQVAAGTYRSHERPVDQNGRVIDAGWAQLYGKAFGVYWPWLLKGDATPDTKYATETPIERRWQELTPEERRKALDLLDIATRKTG